MQMKLRTSTALLDVLSEVEYRSKPSTTVLTKKMFYISKILYNINFKIQIKSERVAYATKNDL